MTRRATEEPARPPAPSTPTALWWPDLDSHAAIDAWAQIAAFVQDALLARHPQYLRILRPCWRRHPDVVDELTALRLVWLGAYGPQAEPGAAADYLARVPAVLGRVEAAFKSAGCHTAAGRNVHENNDHRYLLTQWHPDELADFIAADTAGRTAPGR